MKTKMILGIGIMLMSAANYSPLSAENAKIFSEGNKPIIIRQDPIDLEGAPRMPAYNPFFAELMDGYVILGSSTVYGTVSVSLTSTAGDYYSTSFDTTDGAILLPISGDAGLYTLRITTSGGLQFVGEFTI